MFSLNPSQSVSKWAVSTLAFVMVLVASVEVFSKNVSPFSPQSLVRALQDAGYQASLTRTEDGLQVIDSATGGNRIRLLFMDYDRNTKAIEFVGYWDCSGRMKECIRNTQTFNDEESPAKAIPFTEHNQVGVCYYVLFDEAGISEKLFITNLEVFSFYNQKFARMFD